MTVRSYLSDKKGAVGLRVLIWLAILGSAVVIAVKLAPPYITYLMIKTDVKSEAKLAHMYNDESLRKRILTKAVAWGIPITAEDIVMERRRTAIAVRVKYKETVDFFGKYRKDIDFSIFTEAPLKESEGTLQ
ncbi:MAG: DUF4845 domain-containing protein [Deltaproteobacteria bacterium]|nr:DUF4845 domain-containing protein [Deltaproteobacteria bacterium]